MAMDLNVILNLWLLIGFKAIRACAAKLWTCVIRQMKFGFDISWRCF